MEVQLDFLDEIAQLTPVPAGGAACAYTSTMAVALVYKVLLFQLHRAEVDPQTEADLGIAQSEVGRIYLDLKRLVHDEPLCYLTFADGSASGDQGAEKAAFLDIMTCSMEVIQKTSEGLEWVGKLSRISSPGLKPHLRVAAELLGAALAGTAHVVRENIHALRSEKRRDSYMRMLEELYEDAVARKDDVMKSL